MSIKNGNKIVLPRSAVAKGASQDGKRNRRRTAPGVEVNKVGHIRTDFASDFEEPLAILEDLISIAIDEIGNGGARALSVLVPAKRYVDDLKAVNLRLLQLESGK